MTEQPARERLTDDPLTDAELAAIERAATAVDQPDSKIMLDILRDLKAARAEIEGISDERDLWINTACRHREELDALTSHVASSQPRDGHVVLEVPREVYEKAVQAGGGR